MQPFAEGSNAYRVYTATMLRRWLTKRSKRIQRLEILSPELLRQHAEFVLDELRWWSWNWHDGGRTSLIRDLADLGRILTLFEGSTSIDVKEARGVCDRLQAFLDDDGNYRVDGRSLVPNAAAIWVGLDGEIKRELEVLRGRYPSA